MSVGTGVATVTSVIGPGNTVTNLSLTGVTEVRYNLLNETVQFFCDQGKPIFDITADTTFTITVSGVTYTFAVS